MDRYQTKNAPKYWSIFITETREPISLLVLPVLPGLQE